MEGTAAGTAMAAAAEVLGDPGYIDLSFAADTEAELAGVGNFAEKDGGFYLGNADEVVDDAFAVFGSGADALHVFAGDPGPGEVAFGLEGWRGRCQGDGFCWRGWRSRCYGRSDWDWLRGPRDRGRGRRSLRVVLA